MNTAAKHSVTAQGTAIYFGDRVIIISVLPTVNGRIETLIGLGSEVMWVDYSDLKLVQWIAA